MQSLIINKYGKNYHMKSTGAPNPDPDFWIPDSNHGSEVKAVMEKPYTFHEWVFACVRSIAQNVAQIERNIISKVNDNIIDDHKVKRLLNKPNKIQDYYNFFFTITCHLLLPSNKNKPDSGGQCFLIPWNGLTDEPAKLGKGEIPSELMPFSAAFFKPWSDSKNDKGLHSLKGWTFEIPYLPESRINFEFNEIIVITVPNPYDILKGSTPFSAAAMAIETDINADIFNNNLFEKQGRLDGQVTTEQSIPKAELDKIKESWYEQYVGTKQRRIAFLSGGLKYEQFGLSSTDLGYIEQGKWNRQKIIGAYGLNRIALGDYEDVNLAIVKEGRKMLWYDRYIPIDRLITSAFNGQWIQNIDKGSKELKSDYSEIPALQNDLRERVAVGGILCEKMGFPPELSARIMNITLREEDLQRWPHLSEQLKKNSPFDPLTDDNKSLNKNKSFNSEQYSYSYIKSSIDPAEKRFRVNLDKYFIKQRNKILDEVDRLVTDNNKSILKVISVSAYQFLPDEALETFTLLKMYKEAAKLQMALEKKQVENEINHLVEWDTSSTRLDYWTSLRGKYMSDVTASTFKHIRDAINATVSYGNSEGFTVSEMRAEIKKAVQDVYKVRTGAAITPNGLFDLGGMSSSKTIARTEMGSIATLTRVDIFKEEGIEKIEWVTAHDEKVRETHINLDGKKSSFGDYFNNSPLRWPRDNTAPAKEIINCRCSFVAAFD